MVTTRRGGTCSRRIASCTGTCLTGWRRPGPGSGSGTLFADAAARAQAAVDTLWRDPPHPPHLVHGDLTPPNVIVAPRVGLVPIDFQDTVAAWRRRTCRSPSPRCAACRTAAGWKARSAPGTPNAAWPDVSPDLFDSLVEARWLHQLNLTLNVTGMDGLAGYVAGHAARARAWMRPPSGG